MSDSNKDKMWRLGVLVSGNGTNLQALIDACKQREIKGEIVLVASNRKHAYALVRAREAGIPTLVFEAEKYKTKTLMCSKMAQAFKEKEVDLICLAGYLLKLEPCLIRSFPRRIINIHPALLPKYGGTGMYGHHVHKAVLANKETESGCTVHLVDEIFDHGPILAQNHVPVKPDDTAETLAQRIRPKEHELYVSVVKHICTGKLDLDNFKLSDVSSRGSKSLSF